VTILKFHDARDAVK